LIKNINETINSAKAFLSEKEEGGRKALDHIMQFSSPKVIFSRLGKEFSFIRGNFLILTASALLIGFVTPIPDTYYSLFILELGGTPFILGLIGFAYLMTFALVQFLGGYLADRHGRRRLIVVMTFALALSFAFYALAPTWHFVMIGTMLSSLSLIHSPALRAMESDSLPTEKRGVGFSVSMVTGTLSIISPLVAGFLYLSYGLVRGMRIAYVMVMGFFLLAAIIRTKLRETLDVGTGKIGLVEALRAYPKAIRESIGVWRQVPRDALYLFLIGTAGGFFAYMCMPYYVIYANAILHIDEFQWAILQTLNYGVMFGSALPIGKLVDLVGRKRPLMASNILFMLSMWFFIYGDFPRLAVFLSLSAVGNSLMVIAEKSIMADLVPREHRGKVMGYSAFIGNVTASVGQLMGGFLYESLSPQLPFLLLLTSFIPTTALTLFLVHEPKEKER